MFVVMLRSESFLQCLLILRVKKKKDKEIVVLKPSSCLGIERFAGSVRSQQHDGQRDC